MTILGLRESLNVVMAWKWPMLTQICDARNGAPVMIEVIARYEYPIDKNFPLLRSFACLEYRQLQKNAQHCISEGMGEVIVRG
jgi:hypothetical protein